MSADRSLPRALLIGLGALALLTIVSSVWVLKIWVPVPAVSGEMLSVLTAFVSVACCLVTAVVSTGAMRVAWCMFSLMMAMYGLGDALWLVFGGLDGDDPILGMADALYMGAFVPATLGLVAYPVFRGIRGMWRPLLLDASVLAAAVLFISHVLVLRTVFASSGSTLQAFMLTIYPVTDVLFASLVLLLLLRSVGQRRLDVVLVGATFAIYTFADNGYALLTLKGQDTAATLIDVGYTVAPLVLAAAALFAATTPTPRRTLRRHLTGVLAPLLPDLTALLALTLALAVNMRDPLSAILGIITLTAVGVRQVAQTSSGQELRTELQRRVTERTEELAEVTEHYRRLDGMKYEFVTAVSHELRTPLTAIRGSLEMLHDGDAGELPPSARSVVAIATRGSERLSRLVDDIIDMERLESGGFGFAPARHEVSDLLREATESLQPLAQEQVVDVTVEAAAGAAWCDPDRVVQVMVNLLGNALKFSPPLTTVSVTAVRNHDEFVVSVRDQGRGIPASELTAVFDRFHQVDVDDSRQLGGAGLGLTICQRIIDHHGGRIWVESPGEHGATFRFTLPVAKLAPGDESSEVLTGSPVVVRD